MNAHLTIENKKVGESAVNILEAHFNRANNVLTHFSKDDTGVCVDGAIEVYTSTTMTKGALYGEIPVQIKGTLSKPSGRETEKRKVDVLDLEKYLDVYAGVLYFVVFMDKSFNSKGIYYKQYLPYDIHEALSRKKRDNQATLTEKFLPLPDDADQLRRLCLEFISDQRKQRGTGDVGFLMPGELETSGIHFQKVELTKTLFSDEFPVSLKPFETGAYLYGTTSGGKRYVLDRIGPMEMIQSTSTHTIGAGNYECEAMVDIGEDHEGTFLALGGISLRFGGTGAIKYTDRGGFRNRLRDAKLFRGFALSGEIYLDGSFLGRADALNGVDLDELDRRIEVYEKYVSLMDLLGVVPDWDPSKLSKNDFGQIRRLGEGLEDGSHLSLGDHSESMIVLNSDIAGARIKVVGRRDEDGLYEIFDLTSPDLTFATCRGENGELDTENPMPTLFSLASADLKLLANINQTRLEQALERCPVTAGSADASNNALLEMLTAYDEDAVCEKELLACCGITSKALYDLDPTSEVYAINRAQTLYRMHQLDDGWKDKLRGMAASSDSKEVRTSAFILINQHKLAVSCLDSLGELERKRFMTWPIYKLLKH